MNAARRAARTGRNLLIALLIGAVIIVAIIAASVAGRGSGTTTTTAPSTDPSSASASGSPSTSEEAGSAPTGCLGGSARNAGMLLAAQKSAAHSAYGAVEVAAAFSRWAYRYPYSSATEANEVSRTLIAANASKEFKDIAGSYASAGDITNGQVEKGTPFYLSTTTGMWVVDPGSSSNRVTVDLNAAYVIKGVQSATKNAAISATLVWTNAGWRVLSEQQPDASALSAGGTQFTAGC